MLRTYKITIWNMGLMFLIASSPLFGQVIQLDGKIADLNSQLSLYKSQEAGDFEKALLDLSTLVENSQAYRGKGTNFEQAYYWTHFTLKNESTRFEQFVLNISNYTIGEIFAYLKNESQWVKLNQVRESKALIPHRNFAYPFNVAEGDSLVFALKIWTNGDPLASPMRILPEHKFLEKSTIDNYVYGYFFSFFLIVLIIAFITWFFLREQYVLFYALHLICLGAFLFSFEGYSLIYFTEGIQFIKKLEQPLLAGGVGIFFILFVLSFFRVKEKKKILYRNVMILLIALSTLFIFLIGGNNLGNNSLFFYAFLTLASIWVFSISLFLYTGVLREEIGKRDFVFYFAAFAFVNIGVSFHFWAYFGILPDFWFDIKIMHLCALLEIVIFTYFIIDKIISINKSRTTMAIEMANQKEKSFKDILQGEENERQRIAKELHDGLGLLLSTINTRISDLADKAKPENQNQLNEISDRVEQACQDVRTTSHSLASHILTRSGFLAAMENSISLFRTNYPKIRFSFSSVVSKINLIQFDKVILFKVCQDLLNKIIEYDDVKKVGIGILEEENKININYRLDGFTKEDFSRMSITNILARINLLQGDMDLLERPNKSLMIMIDIPVDKAK